LISFGSRVPDESGGGMEGIIIEFSIFAMGDDDTIGTARDFTPLELL
jgi:hypothetical protein